MPSPLTSPAPLDREAGNVVSRGALDDRSASIAARSMLAGKPGSRAEHHIAGAGIVTAVRVGTRGADDQVVDAVAVDVAGRATETAGAVVRRGALDGQRRRRLARSRLAAKPGSRAEHDIAGAGMIRPFGSASGPRRSGRRCRRR